MPLVVPPIVDLDVDCQDVINEIISLDFNASYLYMFAYFGRHALMGLVKFFDESSDRRRDQAWRLAKYQNMRGGRTKFIISSSEYDNEKKGDALYAMEHALSLEELRKERLLYLHKLADEKNDLRLTCFVDTECLSEQEETIKKISSYVSQLRKLGVQQFDQMLLREGA